MTDLAHFHVTASLVVQNCNLIISSIVIPLSSRLCLKPTSCRLTDTQAYVYPIQPNTLGSLSIPWYELITNYRVFLLVMS